MVPIALHEFRRAKKGNGFPPIAAINPEVFLIDGDYCVVRIDLAHPNDAKIGEIGFTVSITLGKFGEFGEILRTAECNPQHPVPD
jgi:hypothetical protein